MLGIRPASLVIETVILPVHQAGDWFMVEAQGQSALASYHGEKVNFVKKLYYTYYLLFIYSLEQFLFIYFVPILVLGKSS